MGYFKQDTGYGFDAGSAFAPTQPPAYNFDNWGRQQQPMQMAMPFASEMPMPGAPGNSAVGGGGFDGFLGESSMSFTPGAQSLFEAPKADFNSWMPDWMKGAVGTSEAPGWGGMAMGAAGGLAKAYMGMKQYGLAKETLAFNKDSFNKQYDAQKNMTNSKMEDRQRARQASNPGAYQSPSDYMTKYGIK